LCDRINKFITCPFDRIKIDRYEQRSAGGGGGGGVNNGTIVQHRVNGIYMQTST